MSREPLNDYPRTISEALRAGFVGIDDPAVWAAIDGFVDVSRGRDQPVLNFQGVDRLIEAAVSDASAFDALRMLTGIAVGAGVAMPPDLRKWARLMLWGLAKPPKRPTRKRSFQKKLRDKEIAREILTVVMEGELAPTRNAASPARSACDVVADRRRITYDAAEVIWKAHKKSGFE